MATTNTLSGPSSGAMGSVSYNPASVMLNQGTGSSSSPYVVGAQSVRATGTGAFDNAYRQNLATYAGGQFARPNGSLSFNPTSNVQNWGAASGDRKSVV